MSALTERNKRVAHARKLGIDKPHLLKQAVLEEAIAQMEWLAKRRKEDRLQAGDPFDDIDPAVEGDHLTQEAPVVDTTREGWLQRAIQKLIPLLEQAGAKTIRTRRLMVSVSLPSKTIRSRVGECHTASASPDGDVNHLLISPLIYEPVSVLAVLAHELVHADDNCASGHNGHFRIVAKRLGLIGKMTNTEVGEALYPVLKDIAEELGPYPHVKLKLAGNSAKVQSTRLIKVHCVDFLCPHRTEGGGYTIRVTQKWIAVGLPACPCGQLMTVAD